MDRQPFHCHFALVFNMLRSLHRRPCLLAIPLMLAACVSTHEPTPKSASPDWTSAFLDGSRQVGSLGTISGRVLLNGHPVSYYGISITEGTSLGAKSPTKVQSADGRFSIRRLKPGKHVIVFVGPGFSRHFIREISVKSGQTTNVGDVIVHTGHTIKGTVTDDAGQVVVNATVRIVQSATVDGSPEDILVELSRGNYSTTTDDRGAFVFEGVSKLDGHSPRLVAALPSHALSSMPRLISDNSATIDIVVSPTGILEGSIAGEAARNTIIVARSATDLRSLSMAKMENGNTFTFGSIPRGLYDVYAFVPPSPKALGPGLRVSVISGQVVTVSLTIQLSGVAPQLPTP